MVGVLHSRIEDICTPVPHFSIVHKKFLHKIDSLFLFLSYKIVVIWQRNLFGFFYLQLLEWDVVIPIVIELKSQKGCFSDNCCLHLAFKYFWYLNGHLGCLEDKSIKIVKFVKSWNCNCDWNLNVPSAAWDNFRDFRGELPRSFYSNLRDISQK